MPRSYEKISIIYTLDSNDFETLKMFPLRAKIGFCHFHQLKSRNVARISAIQFSSASDDGKGNKLWGGRFEKGLDPIMERFNASISFDKRLGKVDIQGSIAYSRGLSRCGILSNEEQMEMERGLNEIYKEWESGSFVIKNTDEDVHTANERRLTELVGDVALKLHTGRSRNDQVATDVRLWLIQEGKILHAHMTNLIKSTISRAEREVDVLMPGYTHLQPAQPIRWSHWLMAHVAAWQRDADRLLELLNRTNRMPLGSGALAGHAFGLNRQEVALELRFADITPNSLDAVSDRDFIAEFLFWASLLQIHLSKLAEDLIIYSSQEFGFVKLSDAYATGSSLMPQKKNPDALELLRGKSGPVSSALFGLLVTLKGLPSTYNKDLQEDKQPLFATVDTMADCIQIAQGVIDSLSIKPEKMRSSLYPEMMATDLADFLVRKGVPFRETHHIAGRAVKMAEDKGISVSELSQQELASLHPKLDDPLVFEVWKPETSVESRNSVGGTSKSSVLTQVKLVKKWLSISTSTANQLGATSQFAGSAVSPSRTNFVSPQLLDHFLGRDLISLRDYTPEEILQILEASSWLKSKLRSQSYRDHPIKFMEMIQNYQPLIGRTVSMIFQKRSTRTRVSTESAVSMLGGHALFLGAEDIQLGVNESLLDTARVLSRFNDLILARVFSHSDVVELAKESDAPVINGLSDWCHPLQALADLMTLQEHFFKTGSPGFDGKKLAWVGDGCNVLHSILHSAPRLGMHVSVATPEGYEPDKNILEFAQSSATNGRLSLTKDPVEAVKDANVIVTDTWISMGQENESKKRLEAFKNYQVTMQLAKHAAPGWCFLHCLPRHKEEVDDEVFYSNQSLVFPEAENRKWTVMAMILALVNGGV